MKLRPPRKAIVKRVLAECLGLHVKDIRDESKIIDDLGADSLDSVEIVMALEDEYAFQAPDEAWEKVITVADAVNLINEKVPA